MILDTFFLLFKSDSSQAAKGIDELDKKISSLTEKGKKRSEQESKDLKESLKQRKELNQSLKDTQEQYEKIAQNIVQAATAAFTFGSITKGFLDTANNNSNLQVQAKLLGQNTVELKAYGNAVEAAGGEAGEFGSLIQSTFHDLALQGGKLPSIPEYVEKVRTALKGVTDPAIQEQIFSALKVSGQGNKSFFLLPESEFKKAVALQTELAENTEKGAETARKWKESWANTTSALDAVYTSVGSDLLPAFQKMNEVSTEGFKSLKDHEHVAEALGLGLVALSGIITAKLVPALASLGTAGSFALSRLLLPVSAAVLTYDNVTHGKDSLVGGVLNGVFKKNASLFGLKPEDFDDSPTKKSPLKTSTPGQKDSYKTTSEPLFSDGSSALEEQRKLANGGVDPYAALKNAKASLAIAQNSTIGLSGGDTNSTRAYTIKTGDIHINTNATNAQGIASNLSDELTRHFSAAISNMDDGVAR